MNNWEVNYEKIGEEADEIYENNQPYSYARAFIEAIIKVANIKGYNNQVTVLKSIDWLTQEATVCNYCKDNTCELRTIDKECFGTEDLMECCGMLTRQEVESEEPNVVGRFAGTTKETMFDPKFCENGCAGCLKLKAEPQQSKARFVKCHEKGGDEHIIDIRCIDEIGYNTEECATELVLYDYGRYFIRKPIDEVIQQLGIEVV